ncbi:MAG: hypothetical protein ABJA57_11610 [Ginsengibacter sp.]
MKNTLLFYICVFLPLLLIVNFAQALGPSFFGAFLFIYVFLYRPTLDVTRLVDKGVINRMDFWKTFFLFRRTSKYFRQLYLP